MGKFKTGELLRRRAAVLAAGVMLGAWSLVASAATPRTVENTFATVVVGDISGLIDHVGELASKVQPGLNAQALRAQAGAMIGDPDLAAFPKGKGLVVVFPENGFPYALLEVASDKQDDVKKLIEGRAHGSVEKVQDGLLAISRDADSAKQATTEQGKTAASFLEGDGQPTILVTVSVKKLLDHFKTQIEEQLDKIPENIAKRAKARGAKNADQTTISFMMHLYYSIAKRIDVGQLNIGISGDGIQFDKTLYPVGGMNPVPAPATRAADLDKLLPPGKMIRMIGNFDTSGLTKSISEVVADAAAGAKIQPDQVKGISEFLEKWSAIYDGGFAVESTMDSNGLFSQYAWGAKEPGKVLDGLKAGCDLLNGPLGEFYKSTTGMETSASLTRDVRKVQGVSVSQFAIHITPPDNMGEKEMKMFQLYANQKYDIAIIGNKALMSQGEGKIDKLIAAEKSGSNPEATPLESVKKLPEGGFVYMDYGLGSVADFMMSQILGKSGQNAFSSAPPLLIAGYRNADNYKFTLRIPSDFLVAAKNGVMQVMASHSAVSSSHDTDSDSDSDKPATESDDDRKPSDSDSK